MLNARQQYNRKVVVDEKPKQTLSAFAFAYMVAYDVRSAKVTLLTEPCLRKCSRAQMFLSVV